MGKRGFLFALSGTVALCALETRAAGELSSSSTNKEEMTTPLNSSINFKARMFVHFHQRLSAFQLTSQRAIEGPIVICHFSGQWMD